MSTQLGRSKESKLVKKPPLKNDNGKTLNFTFFYLSVTYVMFNRVVIAQKSSLSDNCTHSIGGKIQMKHTWLWLLQRRNPYQKGKKICPQRRPYLRVFNKVHN